MALGPLVFGQPFALLGLLTLPIIWWLLRATPPEPQRRELPSLALLDDLDPREETPDKTPWWIIALRFAAAALVILGFARPSIQPIQSDDIVAGPILIIVDDGWSSAPRWREMTRTALAMTDVAAERGLGVGLVFTAPQGVATEAVEIMQGDQARRRIQSAQPAAWAPNRQAALELITGLEVPPAQIIWVSDGLNHGFAREFMETLKSIAPLEIRPLTPRGAYAITEAGFRPDGAALKIQRAKPGPAISARISAENSQGSAIASAEAIFDSDSTMAQAEFKLPSAALNRIARFRILGVEGAGAVWLWDDAAQAPSVALADPIDSPQPLLEEFYYVRKALQDGAQLIEGPLDEMLDSRPNAIVLGDRSDLSGELGEKLAAWIEEGGALIRFSGPLLAANDDAFTPTALRPAARALGGALAWDDPQTVAPFPSHSPFADLSAPEDALVKRQVLAQPQPDLDRFTWARLADGTPLVTAATRGRGAVILFHVTANPDWSDLPYSGAFPEMLKRAAMSGAIGGARLSNAEGSLTPIRILSGMGSLIQPPATVKPISTEDFPETTPGPQSPPGLYAGPQGSRALNLGQFAPNAIGQWPPGISVIEDVRSSERRGLDGWLIGASLILLLVDSFIALFVSGRLGRFTSKAVLVGMVGLSLFVSGPDASAKDLSEKELEAAHQLRFAYVETGDARRDDVARAGLKGLSYQLFRRSSVEPADPHGVNLGVDRLEFYPMIYFSPSRDAEALSNEQISALNDYMRSGGALVIDTANATPGVNPSAGLETLLEGLNAPPLQPTPDNHVVTRSFYLIKSFPGRLGAQQLWIESTALSDNGPRGDGVSRLFIGSVDWAGAWAVDDDFNPMFPMTGEARQRELAFRFGVNLVMYVLTGSYKEDQVHLPALLERLDEEAALERLPPIGEDSDRFRTIIEDLDSLEDGR